MLKRIIFVCPATSKPVGGIKVVLHHSEILNRLAAPALRSLIYVPEKLDYEFGWLHHESVYKRDHLFDPSSDLVVLPEVMAPYLGRRVAAQGLRYAIFVQNGYLFFPDNSAQDEGRLAEIYRNAALVLSISRDTTSCIERAFPVLRGRVLQMRYSVDPALFHANEVKRDAIAYMPRKLADHARLVAGFLRAADLGGWEIVPIDGMTEAEVAAALCRTRVFLSFSNLEGCPVPPLEAALAGNMVVGYTGEGGMEYWDGPIFSRIESGNIQMFVDRVLEVARNLSGGGPDPVADPVHVAARARLANMFSRPAESETVLAFARGASALFEGNQVMERTVSLFTSGEMMRFRLERERRRLEWFLIAGIKTALSPLRWAPS